MIISMLKCSEVALDAVLVREEIISKMLTIKTDKGCKITEAN